MAPEDPRTWNLRVKILFLGSLKISNVSPHIFNTIITRLNSALPCLSPLASWETCYKSFSFLVIIPTQCPGVSVALAPFGTCNQGFPLFTSPHPQPKHFLRSLPLSQSGCGSSQGLARYGWSLTSPVLCGKELYPLSTHRTVKSAHTCEWTTELVLCHNQWKNLTNPIPWKYYLKS